MRNKRNKFVCVLIALVVFISGIYFEYFKIDSTFACEPIAMNHSNIAFEDPILADVPVCTSEMLGFHKSTGQGQLTIQCANQRRDAKTSHYSLCPDIFSINECKSYTSFKTKKVVYGNQDELITKYIHKSDGKKWL